jgi:hypothetical protein
MRRTEIWGLVLRPADIRAASRRNFMLRVVRPEPARPTALPLPVPSFVAGLKRSRRHSHGGLRKGPAVPPHKILYIEVSDLQATLDAIHAAGGSTLLPPTEVPGVSTFALFKDPAGNVMGLVQG